MPERPASRRSARTRPPARIPDGPRLYDSSAWRRARAAFLAEHPVCVACEARGLVVAAAVVDHKTPHKGDTSLFWDRANWQPLCATCHNRKTATTDGGFGRPTTGT